MIDTRAVFVEGIMGSGKSTIATFIAGELERHNVNSRCVLESELPHPTRVMWELPNPHKPWLDTHSSEFCQRILKKWEGFVSKAKQLDLVSVFDGQFFHGDVTSLLMMDTDRQTIIDHVHRFAQIGSVIRPVLVYFFQRDLVGWMDRIFRARGDKWVDYQIEWKVESPFCKNRGLVGREGLLALYKEYRSITDELADSVAIETLSIDNTDQNWADYQDRILRFLQLS